MRLPFALICGPFHTSFSISCVTVGVSVYLAAGSMVRGGPGCLKSFSASMSGASAGVRLPSGEAAG
jgi:hypothetical protein